jgi:hypothetical protein
MVEAGQILQEITSLQDVLTPWTAAKLALIASLALVPALLARRRQPADASSSSLPNHED